MGLFALKLQLVHLRGIKWPPEFREPFCYGLICIETSMSAVKR
jgi:hypothetical protein